MGDDLSVGSSVVIVVNQEGQLNAVPLDVAEMLLTQGYKLATPAECDQYLKEQRNKSDLRE